MFDNGLLKYYKQGSSTQGYLNAREFGITQNITNSPRRVNRATIDGKQYYLKSTGKIPAKVKSRADAEILLSQIYSKLGLESAIYLPVQNSYGNFLISDDVKTPKTELAGTHLYSFLAGTGMHALPFFYKEESAKKQDLKTSLISKIYTPNAIYEQTKMRVADVASFNADRHYLNFFYSLQRPILPDQLESGQSAGSQVMQYFRNLLPNKVTGIVAIDYEDSGNTLHEFAMGNPYADFTNIYENDFDHSAMPREDVIEQFKTNEEFAQVVNKEELAEELGSVSPSSVAQDIKETTDYEIDPKIVSVLSRSFNEVAEELLK